MKTRNETKLKQHFINWLINITIKHVQVHQYKQIIDLQNCIIAKTIKIILLIYWYTLRQIMNQLCLVANVNFRFIWVSLWTQNLSLIVFTMDEQPVCINVIVFDPSNKVYNYYKIKYQQQNLIRLKQMHIIL